MSPIKGTHGGKTRRREEQKSQLHKLALQQSPCLTKAISLLIIHHRLSNPAQGSNFTEDGCGEVNGSVRFLFQQLPFHRWALVSPCRGSLRPGGRSAGRSSTEQGRNANNNNLLAWLSEPGHQIQAVMELTPRNEREKFEQKDATESYRSSEETFLQCTCGH